MVIYHEFVVLNIGTDNIVPTRTATDFEPHNSNFREATSFTSHVFTFVAVLDIH